METKHHSLLMEDFARCLKALGIRVLHIFLHYGEISGTEKGHDKNEFGRLYEYRNWVNTKFVATEYPPQPTLSSYITQSFAHGIYSVFSCYLREYDENIDNIWGFLVTIGYLYWLQAACTRCQHLKFLLSGKMLNPSTLNG